MGYFFFFRFCIFRVFSGEGFLCICLFLLVEGIGVVFENVGGFRLFGLGVFVLEVFGFGGVG